MRICFAFSGGLSSGVNALVETGDKVPTFSLVIAASLTSASTDSLASCGEDVLVLFKAVVLRGVGEARGVPVTAFTASKFGNTCVLHASIGNNVVAAVGACVNGFAAAGGACVCREHTGTTSSVVLRGVGKAGGVPVTAFTVSRFGNTCEAGGVPVTAFTVSRFGNTCEAGGVPVTAFTVSRFGNTCVCGEHTGTISSFIRDRLVREEFEVGCFKLG